MRYLSPEWMDAARRALAADAGLGAAVADLRLTLEQVVTGTPPGVGDATGTARWHVDIDHGRVELVEGPATDPAADLRLTTTYATAAAVAAGATAAQRAFVEGRLRVGGDLSLLVAHQRTLAALDDALAEVRAETTFA